MVNTLGLLHPGAMGVSVGAAALACGAKVYWVSAGRSEASVQRAEAAGFIDLAVPEALSDAVAVVISICPPDAALNLAHEFMACGFTGIYVDANAVSPATARQIAILVESGGAMFVDGGIIGPPALLPGTTRLYLSGGESPVVAEYFEGTNLEPVVIGTDAGAASAIKMCYAAYTKGSAALLLAIRALATAECVDDALAAEWAKSQPGVAQRSQAAARQSAPKAWRFAGEMREIADTLDAAGLPAGFHAAAAELYAALGDFKDREDVELQQVVSTLLNR